jgi:hypothetical protein
LATTQEIWQETMMANTIFTIIRDDKNLLEDFLVYHLSIGFDKIVIFDDMSEIPVSEFLEALPERFQSCVECFRITSEYNTWTLSDDHGEYYDAELFSRISESKQMYFGNYFLKHQACSNDWVSFVDVDEFISLGKDFLSISGLREAISAHGASAMVFDALIYGHGFNLLPTSTGSLCSFIWRSKEVRGFGKFGHCKFFAHVGSLLELETPHFPTLFNKELVIDYQFEVRNSLEEKSYIYRDDITHLKHYSIQDVFSCFQRKMRGRISRTNQITAEDPQWIDRIETLQHTSACKDEQFAASIVSLRAKNGMPIYGHILSLCKSLESLPRIARLSPTLDSSYLRKMLGLPENQKESTVLMAYFSDANPDPRWLRFETLPEEFDFVAYKAINDDLKNMTERELIVHYFMYGREEGRRICN